jgi:hypothetical protein
MAWPRYGRSDRPLRRPNAERRPGLGNGALDIAHDGNDKAIIAAGPAGRAP